MSKGSRFAHCARLFCDLGFATSPGFRYALSLLSRGGTIYFLGPDPTDILQTLDLHQIEGMATSPYGLGEFLKFFEADSAFEIRFDHIICQGAMLSRELSRRARARMCQNLYSIYGATETTTVAFGPASVTESMPGAVGYVPRASRIEIVDDARRSVATRCGRPVRIRSHTHRSGYVGDPEDPRIHFRDGWFYSGDIGRLTPEDGSSSFQAARRQRSTSAATPSARNASRKSSRPLPECTEAAVFATDNTLGIGELTALIVGPLAGHEQALRDFARNDCRRPACRCG